MGRGEGDIEKRVEAAILFDDQEAEKDIVQSFERESDEGNVEYKLSLAGATVERRRQLTTQMLYRLNEGLIQQAARAVYRVGVADDGTAAGLGDEELGASLRVLRQMADSLGARVTSVVYSRGVDGRVAQVLIEAPDGLSETGDRAVRARLEGKNEQATKRVVGLRVAVVGSQGSGKSTLIGVLCGGTLDNGCGLARASVLRHGHEVRDAGRTSCIAECQMDNTSLFDLAGDEKYLKTTIFGLTALAPDLALLLVDARQQVKMMSMTMEHLGVALALRIKVIVVLTHADTVDTSKARTAIVQLLRSCYCDEDVVNRAIFVVSSVTGEGYDSLKATLSSREEVARRGLIQPPRSSINTEEDYAALVRIDSAYHELPGTVVGGTVRSGTVAVGDSLLLGPINDEFVTVLVASIRLRAEAATCVEKGESATFGLLLDGDFFAKKQGRRRPSGMVLISSPNGVPRACLEFDAEIIVLRAPLGVESVVHADSVRQSARIVRAPPDGLVAGVKAVCRLRFKYHAEFITRGTTFILRDSRTRAVGTVLAIQEAAPAPSSSLSPTLDRVSISSESASSSSSSLGAAPSQ